MSEHPQPSPDLIARLEAQWREKGESELREAADSDKPMAMAVAAMRLHCADELRDALAILRAAPAPDWPERGDCTCDWIRYEEMSQRDQACPRHKDSPDPPAKVGAAPAPSNAPAKPSDTSPNPKVSAPPNQVFQNGIEGKRPPKPTAAPAQPAPTCEGTSNPFVASCGAKFDTYEEMAAHIRDTHDPEPASLPPPTETR